MSKNLKHTLLIAMCIICVGLIEAQHIPATSPQNKEREGIDRTRLKTIAVINSYNENTTWPRQFINQVISEMTLHDDFGPVKVAHLNDGVIKNHEDFNALQERLFEFFTDDKPDYLVLIGNFAFILRDKIKEHWGDIPMLLISQSDKYGPLEYYYTTTVNDDNVSPPKMHLLEDLQDDYNFTAVVTPYKYRETIDMMFQMYPEIKNFVFMGDGTYANRHLSFLIREYLKLGHPEVKYEWLLASENGVMIPYLNNTDTSIGLLLSSWSYTLPGINGSPLYTAGDSYLIKGAKRPVFGLRYSYMNYGILGGFFPSTADINSLMMTRLSEMISGKRMSEIPITTIENCAPYIDYTRMLKLGISESRCPEGSIYVNKVETDWDKYQMYYYGGIILAILVIIILIIILITRRRPLMRRDYNNLVNSMPLGLMQVLLTLDKDRKVKKVEYSEQNKILREIIEEHNLREQIKDKTYVRWQETYDSISTDMQPKGIVVRVPDSETYYEFIVSPDKHSTETHFLANIFVIDISDKMRIENVLRDTARKAIEADNMKTAFLANMSHEIRTPLNAIVGFSHLLCRTTDRKKMDQFIEIIETNNQLLLKLIGDILDISKADSNKLVFNMQTVDVNAVVRSVCRSADISQKPDVRIDMSLSMENCFVTTDSYRLTQVLNNLVTNAIKFTERGHIEVGYRQEGDMLRFFVKDTGFGLSESDKSKLFSRFTKLNSFIQGTGLGLSISQAIVDKLGGSMKAESAGRGKGSEFSFTIPYVLKEDSTNEQPANKKSDEERLADLKRKVTPQAPENDVEANDKSSSHVKPTLEHVVNISSYKREKKKILVVEDNSSNYMLVEALIDNRYELIHAWDGEEAIRMFAKNTPDLVLMDINLPLKNGYEATAEIRLLSKTVPIVAVTAYAQDQDKEKILSSGFNAYLAKPVSEDELLNVLKKYL